MKTFIMALLCLSFANLGFAEFGIFTQKKQTQVANKVLAQIEQEIQTLEDFAVYTNASIDGIIKNAVKNLKLKGSWRLANELEKGWAQLDGELVRQVRNRQSNLGMRAIGDFKPISQWLSDSYEKIEADLGYPFCFSQRITDLKTINHGLVVVFNPCEYGYDEFYKHFAADDPKYRSLFPVVAYWATVMGCYAGSYGTGFLMVCGAAGMMVETMVHEKVAPMVAPQLYGSSCN